MNPIGEMIGAWQGERLLRFFKRTLLVLVLLYFSIAAYGRYSKPRCTPADRALAQAPRFALPMDAADAVAHPEKMQNVRAQVRAIRRCVLVST